MEITPKARSMREWLFSEWTEKLVGIMESMADDKPSAKSAPTAGVPPLEDSLLWRQSFAAFSEPVVWAVIPKPTCLDLGRRTLRSAGLETSEESDEQNTFLEILNQSFAALGQSIGTHLSCEASASDGEQITALPDIEDWLNVCLQFGDTVLEPIWITCSAQLAERLGAGAKPAADAESASVHPTPPAVPDISDATGGSSKTFDLLLDVTLPVSISFGRTFLPIKEILKLTTGSIVELDRAVNDPVDVIINNCVIARGEVVVIEGNYGVRIRQIASRYDRLRTGSALAQIKHASVEPQ